MTKTTETTKTAIAHGNYVRGSASKVRRVLDQIRGRSYRDALIMLEFMPYRSTDPITKVLRSAVANAEHNFGMDPSTLVISSAWANSGPVMKRYRPRAQGRAFSIKKQTYPILLQEDFKIRTFIQKKYGAAGISDVLIARKADQLELELKTARPGVIVGRQGSGIEELRSGIQKTIGDRSRQVRINVVEVERVDADAFLLAEYIAQQLEKRVAFRRTIRMALQRAQRAGVLGLKIQVGGRLNCAEIARTEWTREGRVPLHTLRAEIDYATREANITYGVLGIKVWVFKGEVLPKEEQSIPVGASSKRKASRRPQQFEDRSNENS